MSDELNKIMHLIDAQNKDVSDTTHTIQEIGAKLIDASPTDKIEYIAEINNTIKHNEEKTHKLMKNLMESVLSCIENKLQNHNQLLTDYNVLMIEYNKVLRNCNYLMKQEHENVKELNEAYKMINWNKIGELIECDKESSPISTVNFGSDDDKKEPSAVPTVDFDDL